MFGSNGRAKTAPSHYPRIPFHLLRFAQLVSSLIVGAIMLFFIWHLTHDHWSTPWTFVVLTAVSLLTVAVLTFTIVLHCCCGLQPRLNIILNSGLAILWAMGFAMLAYYMSGTLAHYCDVDNWNDGTGIMVCRIYKAVFTFALLGLVSTLCALGLDFYVYRQQNRRGVYRLHDIDVKNRPAAVRGPFTDEDHRESATFDEPRYSEAFEAPREYTEPPRQMQGKGYAVPEGQFEYDTGYHGGHAERAFGSD